MAETIARYDFPREIGAGDEVVVYRKGEKPFSVFIGRGGGQLSIHFAEPSVMSIGSDGDEPHEVEIRPTTSRS